MRMNEDFSEISNDQVIVATAGKIFQTRWASKLDVT